MFRFVFLWCMQVSKAVFEQKGENFDNSKRLRVTDARVKVQWQWQYEDGIRIIPSFVLVSRRSRAFLDDKLIDGSWCGIPFSSCSCCGSYQDLTRLLFGALLRPHAVFIGKSAKGSDSNNAPHTAVAPVAMENARRFSDLFGLSKSRIISIVK